MTMLKLQILVCLFVGMLMGLLIVTCVLIVCSHDTRFSANATLFLSMAIGALCAAKIWGLL
jgi:hypothetical protein